MSLQKRKTPKGFTLIELVIVIAVIAILAALLVPTILGQADRARVSRAKGEAGELSKALGRMRTDTGSTNPACYTVANLNSATPPSDNSCGTGLVQCTPNNPDHICWNGPYMNNKIVGDPWDKAYRVTATPAAAGALPMIQVITGGPNGTIEIPATQNTKCDPVAGSDDICVIQ